MTVVERTYTGSGGMTTWLDVQDPTDDELGAVAARFGLHEHTVLEAHGRSARPTIRRFADHTYLVAFSGSLSEIDMFLGPTWLVTVRFHDEAGDEWDSTTARQRFEARHGDEATSALLLLTILDALVDEYFDATDVLEDRMEEVEERIFTDDPGPTSADAVGTVQTELFQLRRELLRLRRVIMPLREVLGVLSRQEVPWVAGESLVLARDLYDRMLRVVEVVDEQRELLGNAVDAHLAVISNQMNLVMKKLTAWGAIVFGATLIAGIYGMNFAHMPELDWRFGYPLALGMMATLSLVLYRTFRRRDWL